MIVVSDTSSINYLISIGCVDVLEQLFGAVAIPEAVRAELLDPATPALVRAWTEAPPEWLTIYAVTEDASPELASLDDGERAAIVLAERLAADLILLDERAGRRRAAERGLGVTGLLGVLVEAARRGLLDRTDTLARLEGTTFRASPALLEAVAAQANRPGQPVPTRRDDTVVAEVRAAVSATIRHHFTWLESRYTADDPRRDTIAEVREAMLTWATGCDARELPADRGTLAGDIRRAALDAASGDSPDPLAVAARDAYRRYQALQRTMEGVA